MWRVCERVQGPKGYAMGYRGAKYRNHHTNCNADILQFHCLKFSDHRKMWVTSPWEGRISQSHGESLRNMYAVDYTRVRGVPTTQICVPTTHTYTNNWGTERGILPTTIYSRKRICPVLYPEATILLYRVVDIPTLPVELARHRRPWD